jgi:hypothetical protein
VSVASRFAYDAWIPSRHPLPRLETYDAGGRAPIPSDRCAGAEGPDGSGRAEGPYSRVGEAPNVEPWHELR